MTAALLNQQTRTPLGPIGRYYALLKETKVVPNFWVSSTYWSMCGLKGAYTADGMGLSLVDDTKVMFPFIDITTHKIITDISDGDPPIWSDFPDVSPTTHREFLGYNYIYAPQEIQELKGKQWDTLRKNVRKWPRANIDGAFYAGGYPSWNPEQISDFLGEWKENLPKDETAYEFDVMVRYFLHEGNVANCGFLFRSQNCAELVGLVAWDWNWQFINFRFCLCKDEPFLDEFLRWRFYTYIAGLRQHRLVNDGGILGDAALKQCKSNTNPKNVFTIYGWGGEQPSLV